MNVADLIVTIKANTNQLVSGMRQAASAVRTFTSQVNSATGSVNKNTATMADNFKDVSRIVQGIMVSKAIYGTINAVKEATSSVIDFSNEMEYAQMTYDSLFGNSDLASEFVNVLQDVAAVSPFHTEDIEKATRSLKAYGIETKNLMFVANGALTAAAAQGNPQIIGQITRALGQIYTKGILKAEEARQLAEAGIPVYKILQQQLGLTAKQLGDLADQAIPADVAINALIDGINGQFGNLLENSTKTMRGIIGNIQDNMLILSSEIAKPVIGSMKSMLNEIGQTLFNLKEIMNTTGIGGLFQAIIPPELQGQVKMLIINLSILGQVIGANIVSILRVVQALLPGVISALNAILVPINFLGTILAGATTAITSNATAMKILTTALIGCAVAWGVWKVQAIGAAIAGGLVKVFTGIASAVGILIKMLSALVAHPVWALLAIAGGLFFGLAATTNKWRDALNGIFNSFSKIGGVDMNKMLMPSQKERVADLDKFNKRLDGTANGMDDLAKKTGKAAKAANNLLGFDEVFKLLNPDENKGDGNGIGDALNGAIPNLDIGGLDDALGGMMPSPGGLKNWGQTFMKKMVDALEPFKDTILGAGIGAILGGVLGGLIGGPAGAKIGATLGALAGALWMSLANALGLSTPEAVGIEIGAGIGAAIGWIAGGPAGAAIGAAIGALVGWIGGLLFDGFVNNNWNWGHLSLAVGTGIGAAIGFIVGGPAGAAIGAAIGALVGWIGSILIDGFTTGNWHVNEIATVLAGFIGLAIGGIPGGILGTYIGANIDKVIGWIGEQFGIKWGSLDQFFQDVWNGLYTFFQEMATKSGIPWTDLEKVINNFFNRLPTLLGGGFNTLTKWFNDVYTASSENTTKHKTLFDLFFGDLLEALGINTDAIGKKIEDSWKHNKDTITKLTGDIKTQFDKTWNEIKDINDLILQIMALRIATGYEKMKNDIIEKLTLAKKGNEEIWNGIKKFVDDTVDPMLKNVTKGFEEIKKAIEGPLKLAADTVTKLFGDIQKKQKDSLDDMHTDAKTKTGELHKTWVDWAQSMWDNVFSKFFGWLDDGIRRVKDFLESAKEAAKADYDAEKGSSDKGTTSTGTIRSGSKKNNSNSGPGVSKTGHALGGVFNKEHWAPFAEGNKAEAIIPLENQSAMKPFSDAVANSVSAVLGPIIANMNNSNSDNLRPLYVQTLIADDRGLRELQRQLKLIETQESVRGLYRG